MRRKIAYSCRINDHDGKQGTLLCYYSEEHITFSLTSPAYLQLQSKRTRVLLRLLLHRYYYNFAHLVFYLVTDHVSNVYICT